MLLAREMEVPEREKTCAFPPPPGACWGETQGNIFLPTAFYAGWLLTWLRGKERIKSWYEKGILRKKHATVEVMMAHGNLCAILCHDFPPDQAYFHSWVLLATSAGQWEQSKLPEWEEGTRCTPSWTDLHWIPISERIWRVSNRMASTGWEALQTDASSDPAVRTSLLQAGSWQVLFEATRSLSRITSYQHIRIQASDLNAISGEMFWISMQLARERKVGGGGRESAVKQKGSVKIASPRLREWLICCQGVNGNTSFQFKCLQAFFFNNLSFLVEKSSCGNDLWW